MLNAHDILETITMIQEENLDIRTITMGISLLDCADSDIDKRLREDLRQNHPLREGPGENRRGD